MKFNNLKWVPKVSCLMAFSIISKYQVTWYLYNGYSRHITRDSSIFTCLQCHNRESVTFGDNGKGKVIHNGVVGKSPYIENVYLVQGLKYDY